MLASSGDSFAKMWRSVSRCVENAMKDRQRPCGKPSLTSEGHRKESAHKQKPNIYVERGGGISCPGQDCRNVNCDRGDKFSD